MLVYQVKATVENSHAQIFEDMLLHHHVKDLLDTGCFESATFSEEKFNRVEGARVFISQYYAKDSDSIRTYLKDHAPKLREDVLKAIGSHMKTERMILVPSKEFD